MGSFDMLSDDDPRFVAHEERELKNKYSTKISEFSDVEIYKEFNRRFKGTNLGDLVLFDLLDAIGFIKIKNYLKEIEGYYLQRIKKHPKHMPF